MASTFHVAFTIAIVLSTFVGCTQPNVSAPSTSSPQRKLPAITPPLRLDKFVVATFFDAGSAAYEMVDKNGNTIRVILRHNNAKLTARDTVIGGLYAIDDLDNPQPRKSRFIAPNSQDATEIIDALQKTINPGEFGSPISDDGLLEVKKIYGKDADTVVQMWVLWKLLSDAKKEARDG